MSATSLSLDVTAVDLLGQAARTDPDRLIVRLDDFDVTARWWQDRSQLCASLLLERGLRKGDRVATLLSNRREALVLWMGMARAGIVEVPINTAMKGDLLADQIKRAHCRAIVVEEGLAPGLNTMPPSLADLDTIIIRDDPADFNRLLDTAPDVALPPPPSADDESVVLYTSGTTGPSKGVVLTHRANIRLATAAVENVGIGPADVIYTAFPLFHVAARFVSVVPALLSGGHAIVHRRFSASRFWDICRSERVTTIHYLGTLPMMLWNQPERSDDANHEVRVAYGAGMPTDVWKPFVERFGLERVHELYGSTEQGIVAINTVAHEAVGTCGRPVDYATVEIHDAQDRPVATGEAGEIVVRSEQPGIFFRGYDGLPEATLAAWRNLWFHTGDRGRFDPEGNLVFLGRIKDAIRRRGENVSAFEVESVADSHPSVIESAAVGVPSDIGEEEILLVAVTRGGLQPADLAHHCSGHLPNFAVPRYIRLADALPKNTSERVMKHELAFVDETTWDGDAATGRQT